MARYMAFGANDVVMRTYHTPEAAIAAYLGCRPDAETVYTSRARFEEDGKWYPTKWEFKRHG
jgi:hypothetical protein